MRCPECGALVDTSDPHQLRSWPGPFRFLTILSAPGVTLAIVWWFAREWVPVSVATEFDSILACLALAIAIVVAFAMLRQRAHPAEYGLLAICLTLLAMGLSLCAYMSAHLIAQLTG